MSQPVQIDCSGTSAVPYLTLPSVCAESRELLQLHLKDLGSRERAVHAQLAALNEDSGDDWQE